MVKNFRFTEPGQIALSGVPETAEQVAWLQEQGVEAVMSLHPVPQEAAEALLAAGIAHLDFPVRDFGEPLPGELRDLARFIQEHASGGVLIH
jgi:hypothetical protein